MTPERRIRFPCGTLSLEGVLRMPLGGKERAGAVLCHPHPLYGGSMDNNVVLALGDALCRSGFAVLRFNFRGVGESGGRHGGGMVERGDVAAAIDCLAGALHERDAYLAVVGYSFGAAVGVPVGASDSRVRAVVAVAPPLGVMPMDRLASCKKPKLALVGSADAYCSRAAFQRWYEALPEPKKGLIVPDADHLLVGREAGVGRAVTTFLVRHSSPPESAEQGLA